MINVQYEIIIIACLTAAATAIPGSFLVQRRMSMMADAISHSIILGVVIAFLFVERLDSPLLLLSAAATGVLTVVLVEALYKTRLVKEDTAIGIVYPLLFALAVLIISIAGSSNIHLDVEDILTGELAYASFNRFFVSGIDIGPTAAWQMGGIFVINVLLVITFYKEILVAVFDESFAHVSGFSPQKIHYGLMIMTAITTVAAFEVAGVIMVVGLIVGPAVLASFFSKRLSRLIILAVLIGVVASVLGYSLAHSLDVSIAGSIVSLIGVFFILATLFAPSKGIIFGIKRRKQLRADFYTDLLLVHILQHELMGNASEENAMDTISVHFNWNENQLATVIGLAKDKNLLTESPVGLLSLSASGAERARTAMEK